MENVSKVSAVGDEHVAGDLMPEGIPESAESVGFGKGAVEWWPVLWYEAVSVQRLHVLRSLDYDLWLTASQEDRDCRDLEVKIARSQDLISHTTVGIPYATRQRVCADCKRQWINARFVVVSGRVSTQSSVFRSSVEAERKRRRRVEGGSVHVKDVKGKEMDGNFLNLLNEKPSSGVWCSLLWYAFDLVIPSNATRVAVQSGRPFELAKERHGQRFLSWSVHAPILLLWKWTEQELFQCTQVPGPLSDHESAHVDSVTAEITPCLVD